MGPIAHSFFLALFISAPAGALQLRADSQISPDAAGDTKELVRAHPLSGLGNQDCIAPPGGPKKQPAFVQKVAGKNLHEHSKVKKIFYINLDGDTERKESMESQAPNFDTPVDRFAALSPANVTESDWKKFSNGEEAEYMGKIYNKEERDITNAIYFSHTNLLEHISKTDPEGEDPYLILEDDASLHPEWQAKTADLIANTPADWDIIYVGYWGERVCADRVNEYVFERRNPLTAEQDHAPSLGDQGWKYYVGQTGYLVKPKSAAKVLNALRAGPVKDIDDAMWSNIPEGCKEDCMKVYSAALPFMAVQDKFLGSHKMDASHPGWEVATSPWWNADKKKTNLQQKDLPKFYKTVTQACDQSEWFKRDVPMERSQPAPLKKIFYIHLNSDPEREVWMQGQCKDKVHNHGVTCEAFPAFSADKVDDSALKLHSNGKFSDWLHNNKDANFYAAVHISNFQVLEHILKTDEDGPNGEGIYMVVEDDCEITPNWHEQLPEILKNTPANWEVIRVGFWGKTRPEDRVNDFVFSIQPPACEYYAGNTGYLVQPKSIPKILEMMKASKISSIENFFQYPIEVNGAQAQVMGYAVSPENMLAGNTPPWANGFPQKH